VPVLLGRSEPVKPRRRPPYPCRGASSLCRCYERAARALAIRLRQASHKSVRLWAPTILGGVRPKRMHSRHARGCKRGSAPGFHQATRFLRCSGLILFAFSRTHAGHFQVARSVRVRNTALHVSQATSPPRWAYALTRSASCRENTRAAAPYRFTSRSRDACTRSGFQANRPKPARRSSACRPGSAAASSSRRAPARSCSVRAGGMSGMSDFSEKVTALRILAP
jgi:hypothetical protein